MAKSQNLPPSPGPPKSPFSFVFKRGLTVLRGPVVFCVFLVIAYFSLVLLVFAWFGLFWDLAIRLLVSVVSRLKIQIICKQLCRIHSRDRLTPSEMHPK